MTLNGKKDMTPSGRGPFAIRLAELDKTDVILNVGSFDGALERKLIRGKVANYFGVDSNVDAINAANSFYSLGNGSETPHFLVSNAETLPFEDMVFDKVLCLDTLEHVDDERTAISEIHRVLKPGGKLVLSVPHDFLNFLDPDEITRGLRNAVRKYIKKTPLLNHPKHRHYSESELRLLLKGFEIEKVHRCGTPIFWVLAMVYTAIGLPNSVVSPLRRALSPLENLDYKIPLPTGFNIMIRARKI